MIWYRTSLKDIFILVAVVLVGLYLTFEYDIFKNADGVSVHERTVELDEALLLGCEFNVSLMKLRSVS